MIRATRALAAIAVAAACLLGAAGSAGAYVRYRSDAGVPYAWPRSCLGIIVYPAAIADLMPADQVLAAATAAGDAWSAAEVAGTALDIQMAATDLDPPLAAYDGQNSMLFRHDQWCNATDTPGTCTYDPSALALTTVFARKQTGEILDADIEVNATTFLWADLELGTHASADLYDLQNALTHELGHFIGLDHPCLLASSTSPMVLPIDNLGNPVPDCDVAPAAIMESTMYPVSMPGDVSKRTLSPDDQLAAREIYPASGGAPAVCPPPEPKVPGSSGGCALGGATPPAPGTPPWLAAAIALGAASMRIRCRRSRRGR